MIQLQGKSDRRYDQRWEAGKILASPFSVLAEPGLIDLGCPAQALMGFSLVSIRFIHSVTSQEIFNILSLGCRAIWLLYFEWVEMVEFSVWFLFVLFFLFYFCFAFLLVVLPLLLNILCNPVHSGASSISILCAENLLDTWRCVLWVCNPSGSFSTASLQLKNPQGSWWQIRVRWMTNLQHLPTWWRHCSNPWFSGENVCLVWLQPSEQCVHRGEQTLQLEPGCWEVQESAKWPLTHTKSCFCIQHPMLVRADSLSSLYIFSWVPSPLVSSAVSAAHTFTVRISDG